MAREFGGGGPKRRYEDERSGPRFFQENPRWRRSEDEDLRRESELRDRAFREREQPYAGEYRRQRDGDVEDRKRAAEYRSTSFNRRPDPQRPREVLPGNISS
jgi:hypothetical protein